MNQLNLMTPQNICIFAVILIVSFFPNDLSAQNSAGKEKLKVLIITGGHDFERNSFFEMFDSFKNMEYREVQHPWANYSYNPEIAKDFDVFVFYDMVQPITEEQKEALVKLLHKGKAMVFFHHSLASYQDWPEFEKIIGGHYYLQEKTVAGKFRPKSTFKHNVSLEIKIAHRKHPITKGVDDFTLLDEAYGKFSVLPEVKILLTTRHPKSGKKIGWTHKYGNSSIVYLQSGHDHHAYDDENFRKLLYQAILFAVEDTKSE